MKCIYCKGEMARKTAPFHIAKLKELRRELSDTSDTEIN